MARPLVLLVVAGLVLAVMVALVPGAAPVGNAHASPVAAAVHPAGTLVVSPLNQYGYYESTFYTGLGVEVYFYVAESSGDHFANVSIIDPNATRDGLTNPVATFEVNVSSGSYNSQTEGVGYVLPTSLVYGGWWEINATAPLGGNATAFFEVITYQVSLSPNPSDVLPGYGAKVAFIVEATVNEAAYTHASVAMTAEYYDGLTGLWEPLALTNSTFPVGSAVGSTSYTVPLNASPFHYIYFYVWANVSSNGNMSVSSGTDAWVSEYYDAFLYVDCPTCLGSTVPVGAQVELEVYVEYDNGYNIEPLPGATVQFAFHNHTALIPAASVPGTPPAAVITSSNGYADVLFLADSPPFSTGTNAYDQVNISVLAVPSPNGSLRVWQNFTWTFTVAKPTPAAPLIEIKFGQSQYASGDTLVAHWNISLQNGSAPVGWSASFDAVELYSSQGYYFGALNAVSGLSGTITFSIPVNYTGYIEVAMLASNATDEVYGYAETDAYAPAIILTPSEYAFAGGDTVTVTVTPFGSVVNASTIYYTVLASTPSGGGPTIVLAQGTVVGGAFEFTIPKSNVPLYVYITTFAQNPTLGDVASAGLTLDEKSGYTMSVGISTQSSYSDGSYQPGQTLTVTWSVTPYGLDTLPQYFYVGLSNWNGEWGYAPPLDEVTTNHSSGSFQYTIPSGTAAGIESLYVSADLNTGYCVGVCYAYGQVSFMVNPSPSALSGELSPGSGLTWGWLILLLIIVVVAVVLIVLILRGRRGPAAAPAPSGTINPPAPPPSSPPPQEWKEPEASGSDQPPMPSPPPGAQ